MKLLKAFLISIATAVACFAQAESLLIGPGDDLKVVVFDTPEMNQEVRVTDAGEIPLLFIGNVKVATLTPGQAARAIEDTLKSKQLMIHPQVSVAVEQYATQQVSVMGEVQKPGVYNITAPLPVIKVLSDAGGLTTVADRNITIQRHDDPQRTVKYFFSNNSADALQTSVMVYPGDIVMVPKAGIVYVLGDVSRPGGYTISDNNSQMTVLEAIATAGGTNNTAIVSKTRLVRTTTNGISEIPIPLGDMQKGKQPDMRLQASDVLYIPFSYMKHFVVNGSQIAASAASAVIYTHP
jgi:polysaccharide export outer membrane protein